ncbi:MAG: carbohydrate ABC transporter permease [Candidatus Heimdallarchaeota archaeon]
MIMQVLRILKYHTPKILLYCILAIVIVITLFPIYWMINTSIKYDRDNLTYPPVFIPTKFTFKNYISAMETGGGSPIINSIIIASLSTVTAIGLAIPAAYSLARLKPKWSESVAFWILSTRMFPPIATVVPLFFLMRPIGLLDTHLGLIIVHATYNIPFAVWMLRGFLIEIPVEIEESALVDGYSRLATLWKVLLPIITGGVVVTALFCFAFSWNEFLFAAILTRISAKTLPVQISKYYGIRGLVWGEMSALSVIATVPMIVLAIVLQKYVVRGITFGMVKK